jgi:DNA-binding transcriptional regulator YdaS (Cro superfamily)
MKAGPGRRLSAGERAWHGELAADAARRYREVPWRHLRTEIAWPQGESCNTRCNEAEASACWY